MKQALAFEVHITSFTALVQLKVGEAGETTGLTHGFGWIIGPVGMVAALGDLRSLDVLNETDGLEVVACFRMPNPLLFRSYRHGVG